MKDLYHALDGF